MKIVIFGKLHLKFARVMLLYVFSRFKNAITLARSNIFWFRKKHLVGITALYQKHYQTHFWPSQGQGPPAPLTLLKLFNYVKIFNYVRNIQLCEKCSIMQKYSIWWRHNHVLITWYKLVNIRVELTNTCCFQDKAILLTHVTVTACMPI